MSQCQTSSSSGRTNRSQIIQVGWDGSTVRTSARPTAKPSVSVTRLHASVNIHVVIVNSTDIAGIINIREFATMVIGLGVYIQAVLVANHYVQPRT